MFESKGIALMEMVAAELQSLEPADAAALVSMIREMADAETDSVRSDCLGAFAENFSLNPVCLERLMVPKWRSYRGARVSGGGPIEVKNILSYWGGRSERRSDPIRPCLRTSFLNEGL